MLLAVLALTLILSGCPPTPTKTYTVSFDLNYDGAGVYATQTVNDGEKALKPTDDPTREGYTFAKWCKDAEGYIDYNFNESVTKNTTVYATWTKNAAVYAVTFSANAGMDTVTGMPAVQNITEGNKAAEPPAEPHRDDYDFLGWFIDAAGSAPFNFNNAVTGPVTVYAGWISQGVEIFTVTLDYNFMGKPENFEMLKEAGSALDKPADPGFEGRELISWYADADYTDEYDFEGATVTKNMTLYALWKVTFEAEWVDLTGKEGAGYSNTLSETELITQAINKETYELLDAGASNGYFIMGLYVPGIFITFNVVSDRAVTDATLILRISFEVQYVELSDDDYLIKVNGVKQNYNALSLVIDETNGIKAGVMDYFMLPFTDLIVIEGVSLKEGVNTIDLVTNNEFALAGTAKATAPAIDCIKIIAKADLTWTPVKSNTEQE